MEEAITADDVDHLAQELGTRVPGSDILRFSGRTAEGLRLTRINRSGR